jgi:hypothetical protein
MVQLHKRFTDSQVKELIERYRSKGIERGYIQEVLGIGKRGSLPSSTRIDTALWSSQFSMKETPKRERYTRSLKTIFSESSKSKEP